MVYPGCITKDNKSNANEEEMNTSTHLRISKNFMNQHRYNVIKLLIRNDTDSHSRSPSQSPRSGKNKSQRDEATK